MRVLDSLSPKMVWSYFEDICQIPHPSKKEEKIIEYLLNFAKEQNLEAKTDEVGNVLISKPAKAGFENRKPIIMQSHMDMVCEKNNDKEHDFDKDPIEPWIDGEWVKAKGTTLGADDGIGMAAQLAILAANDIEHGDIECLFTVDEETGMTGAFGLKPNFFKSNIFLNLDSEDEGEIFVGCAGGIDTVAKFTYKEKNNKFDYAFKVTVGGLQGGHSGDEINKERGNSNKILNRFLWELNKKIKMRIAHFDGGNLRNAIPREAEAVVACPAKYKEEVRIAFNHYVAEMEEVFAINEPNLKLDLSTTDNPEMVIDKKTHKNLLNALYACPHGVMNMSSKMPGMVESSTNLASVKFIEGNGIEVVTSQRSDIDSGKMNVANMIQSVFAMAGAEVESGDGYPGWAPNPNSEIMVVAKDTYKNLFGKEPIVRSIHAGLECGLIMENYPNLDAISFGPTLRDVHSPDEKINIETVQMWWDHLLEILKNAPAK